MDEISITNSLASEAIDFSLFSLFLRADFIVKSVIIILILASVYSWTIIVGKLIRMNRLKKLDSEFDEIFWSGNSFEDLYETFNYNQNDPKSKIFCSAISEWRKSKNESITFQSDNLNSLKERMTRSMQVTFNKESEIIEKN
ncbi:protein TolQ, partial [Alphaproteobacteria bacterium]|nr:protein TolQ [Alphaproteobacteria bacterium]